MQLTTAQTNAGRSLVTIINMTQNLHDLRDRLNELWEFAARIDPEQPGAVVDSLSLDLSSLPTFWQEPEDDDGWSWDRHRILNFDACGSTRPWVLAWRSDLADNKIREILRRYFQPRGIQFRRRQNETVEFKENGTWLLFGANEQEAIARLDWMAGQ